MNQEYLSIKEFAAAVGVSQQAIYKQLNNKLKPYLKVVDNKKMLEKSALSLFLKEEKTNGVEQQLLNLLQTELNEKTEQLKAKDKQIEDLLKALDQAQKLNAMDKQKILELEDKMAADKQEPEEPVKKKWWQKLSS